jgi:molybdopterin-guanine dinucleotide biosynthesis protein
MTQNSKNILLVSGSEQNVGKTSFIRRVIAHNASHKLVAIKISPHFHEPTSGLIPLHVTENYRVFQETDASLPKDSSLFLQAGAEKVFYIQTTDAFLKEAFLLVSEQFDPEQAVIVESAALRKKFEPAFFIFIQKKFEPIKTAALKMQEMADAVVFSDSGQFSLDPTAITFDQTWKMKQDDYS